MARPTVTVIQKKISQEWDADEAARQRRGEEKRNQRRGKEKRNQRRREEKRNEVKEQLVKG